MKYAIVKDGKVIGVTRSQAKLANNWYPLTEDSKVGVNWTHDGSEFHAPVTTPSVNPVLAITGIVDQDAVSLDLSKNVFNFKVGDSANITAEVRNQAGAVITDFNGSFVLPIAGLYGTPAKIKTINVVNGVATFNIQWKIEGMYEVTETQVNHNQGADEPQFEFSKIEFKVEE